MFARPQLTFGVGHAPTVVMSKDAGRLWPLWLYPAVALGVPAAMLASLAFAAPAVRREQGLGTSWLAAFAVLTLPAYLAAVAALAGRLRALATPRVALVAALSVGMVPLVVVSSWIASRALYFAGAYGLSDFLFMGAAVLAPLSALFLSYAIVARLRPALDERAG